MVQTEIRDDAEEPGLEGRLAPELADRAIGLEERFLVNVTSLLLGPHHPQRQPEHLLIVEAHELLERRRAPPLRLADESTLVLWRHDPRYPMTPRISHRRSRPSDVSRIIAGRCGDQTPGPRAIGEGLRQLVEDLPHPAGQDIGGEGLLQERLARREDTTV